MKNLITILILFAFVGCRESENGAYKYRKLTKMEDSVVGTYKRSNPDGDGDYLHIMLRKDGVSESYWLSDDGTEPIQRKIENWKVKNDEIIVTAQELDWNNTNWVFGTYVHRIEEDGGLTTVAQGWTTPENRFERRDNALKDFETWEKVK